MKNSLHRLDAVRADDLLRQTFPPAAFVVSGILPVGLTLLAGRPKLGKSWLCLDIAAAIASGGNVLGRAVEPGDVLYLALEDGPRRLQERLKKLLGGTEASPRLHLATACPALDAGGADAIVAWIKSVPSPRLVVVDVFQRVRPKGQVGGRLYSDDYTSVLPLKALADEHNIAVVAVTHTRKAEAGVDPFDAISATTGLVGAADHALILDRSSTGLSLYGRGRDVEEFDIAVRFDPLTARWTVLGDREAVNRSDTRNAIIAALGAAGEAIGPAEIARRAGLSEAVVKQRLPAIVKAGEAIKVGRGLYANPVTFVTFVTSPSLHSYGSYEGDGSKAGAAA